MLDVWGIRRFEKPIHHQEGIGSNEGDNDVAKTSKPHRITRRSFLKASLAGAGAFSLPTVIVPREVEALEAGQQIHPNISPLRVVGIHDPAMTAEERVRNSWADQEKIVRAAPVGENMDRLACTLAEEKDEGKAWKNILIAPPGKEASDLVVAVKTNNIAQQHTRSPVIAKVCHVLTDVLGVKGENVHIYDGTHGGNLAKSTPFSGLPEGVRIEGKWGGTRAEAPVPVPWQGGKATSRCIPALANGEADILINIALCKGHGNAFGRFTMTMKNHFGTFSPGPGHKGDGLDYLLGINASRAVLGERGKTGKLLFPRQQLCIVDTLWASRGGPTGLPDQQPNRLFMGVFGPVVDYQVATKFRRDTMKWPINENVAGRFLTEFGFGPDDLPEGGTIIDAKKYTG